MSLFETVDKNWPYCIKKPKLEVFNGAAYQDGHAYGEEVNNYFIEYVNMYLEATSATGRFDYKGEFLPYGFN